VPADISEEEARSRALESLRKRNYINSEKQPDKIFYVPGRLVNVVVR
jgi:leucyl-tRNA synthetase